MGGFLMSSLQNLTKACVALSCVLILSACERAAARSCSTAQDAALKVSLLADDLNAAEAAGNLAPHRLADLGFQVVEAGDRYGSKGHHQSYCAAIDRIRVEAGLR
jgi:hypothetical protein